MENEGTSRRDLVLLADKQGNTSFVFVCREGRYVPPRRDRAYGPLMVIGGTGLYETPANESAIEHAASHTKFLSKIMTRKCLMAGLDLTGMKATIPKESAWEKSQTLRTATGFLFSPEGPFKDAITGTDVGITPEFIADMSLGSKIGGGLLQIAGTIEALDTPGSCRYSLDQTYQALKKSETYGDKIPDLLESTVLTEGFGRIGRTAARLWLKKGAKVIVTDPLLTDEDWLLPQSLKDDKEKLKALKEKCHRKFNELKIKYNNNIKYVSTEDLYKEKGQIFCPCSDNEGSLTAERLKKLAANDVKLILSGANGPFDKKNVWRLARLAHNLGIIFPPEILANCGSVSAASAETLFYQLQQEDPDMTAEKFLVEKEIPFIAKNARKKVNTLIAYIKLAEKLGSDLDLYTAGEVSFRLNPAFNIDFHLDENKVLVD